MERNTQSLIFSDNNEIKTEIILDSPFLTTFHKTGENKPVNNEQNNELVNKVD